MALIKWQFHYFKGYNMHFHYFSTYIFLFWNKNEKLLFTVLHILTTALYKFFLSYPRTIFSIYTVQLNQNNFTNYFTERKRQGEIERNNLGNKYASVQK